jgi:hypothetical protein
VILKFLGLCAGAQIAIQITLASPLTQRMGQRIGDRDESHTARHQAKSPGINFPEHTLDALGAVGFIAMDSTEHQETLTRLNGLVGNGFEVVRLHTGVSS